MLTQEACLQTATQQWADAEAQVTQSQQDLASAEAECQTWREQVAVLEDSYHTRQRLERPHSLRAQARRKLAVRERRRKRREQRLAQARTGVERTAQKNAGLQQMLQQRLAQCEQDNLRPSAPSSAWMRVLAVGRMSLC
jgi:hypothetical protein